MLEITTAFRDGRKTTLLARLYRPVQFYQMSLSWFLANSESMAFTSEACQKALAAAFRS